MFKIREITSLNHKTWKNDIHRMEMRSCIYQSLCICIYFSEYVFIPCHPNMKNHWVKYKIKVNVAWAPFNILSQRQKLYKYKHTCYALISMPTYLDISLYFYFRFQVESKSECVCEGIQKLHISMQFIHTYIKDKNNRFACNGFVTEYE